MAAAVLGLGLVASGLASGALAQPGNITLASTAADGSKGNGPSLHASLSADGTRVAFESFSTNLGSDIDGGVYVKDLTSGDLVLASTADDGTMGRGSQPALSADGSKVVFDSTDPNLDPGDPFFTSDVYVKDLTTGDLSVASTSDSGARSLLGHSGELSAISADGTRVAFKSFADDLDPADTDQICDVYVKDLTTRDLVLASTADDGTKGNDCSANPALSSDGTRVAFLSLATNLDPADTDELVADVYVKDLMTGDLVLASTADDGTKGNGVSQFVSLSADGTRVAFYSDSTNLDPADTDATNDVYVKDLTTGDIVLASTADDGTKGNAESFLPALSADGTKVAFSSLASNLDPADTESGAFALQDVYVKDLTTGDIVLASTADDGTTKGNGPSGETRFSLSGDGTTVAFDSRATNLDPADTDDLNDIYVKELQIVPATGTIRVVKDAVPDDPQDFSFSGDLGDFTLDDDGDNTNERSNTAVFPNLAPGTYTAAEAVPAGWDLTALACADSDGGSTVDLATATATIDLDPGETVTCTFTDARLPPAIIEVLEPIAVSDATEVTPPVVIEVLEPIAVSDAPVVMIPDTDGDGVPDGEDACPLEPPARGLDADGDGCTDTIARLIELVQAMPIHEGVKNGLLATLHGAQRALDSDATRIAENELGAFINQVEAQRGKRITESQADLLVAYAINIIVLL